MVKTITIRKRIMEVRFVIETCLKDLLKMKASKLHTIRANAGRNKRLDFRAWSKSPLRKYPIARFPPQPGHNTPVVLRITHPGCKLFISVRATPITATISIQRCTLPDI